MTIKRRIRERGVYAALIAFVYLMTGIFSIVRAQSFTPSEKDKLMPVSSANKSIHHVELIEVISDKPLHYQNS